MRRATADDRGPTALRLLLLAVLLLACRESNSQPKIIPIWTAGQTPLIRVRLCDSAPHCEIAAEGSYRLEADAESVTPVSGQRLDAARIAPASNDGPGFELLGRVWSGRHLRLCPEPAGTVRLRLPDREAWNVYEGTMDFHISDEGLIEVINTLDVETYLVSVIANEMPASFQPEALRAQAIVARTYALYHCQTTGATRAWDVRATERSQVYRGRSDMAAESETRAAVEATRGVVCTWDGASGRKIFCTYYSSTCGGCTQPASNIAPRSTEAPLAGSVRCEYCNDSPAFRWGPTVVSKTLMLESLRKRCEEFGDFDAITTVAIAEYAECRRAARIAVTDGSGRTVTLGAERFRLAVDPTGTEIRSTLFELVVEPDSIVFANGRGYGHGVGLCQWGTERLARMGWSAGQILAYYYPGSQITLAYP
ncbi:MAG: SpoIID/LytB domain-containing protein [Phycisphaerae bacterium]|nr:SpoIID/LytB domain-containing protein [Phycisphaerae bacterium]